MSVFLHIISFDNPYPPDYGGAIEVFYKIKALYRQGVKIILHSFVYGRKPSPELEPFCEKIFYYDRSHTASNLLDNLPHIVFSRANKELLKNLLYPEYPILFEGVHSTYFINHPQLANRFKIVRLHNIEWQYYLGLSKNTWSPVKYYYYKTESEKLKNYDEQLALADLLLCITPADHVYYRSKMSHCTYLPCFHANEQMNIRRGKGEFLLYHGNLSVAENEKAAYFVLGLISKKTKLPLIIAGKNPSKWLQFKCKRKGVQLIANPDEVMMNNLIAEAQINLLPATQQSGIKLKLINALYNGRHCITNNKMADGTGVEKLCTMANDKKDWIQKIHELSDMPITLSDLEKRNLILNQQFNNVLNAEKLIHILKDYAANTSKI